MDPYKCYPKYHYFLEEAYYGMTMCESFNKPEVSGAISMCSLRWHHVRLVADVYLDEFGTFSC